MEKVFARNSKANFITAVRRYTDIKNKRIGPSS